MTTSRVDPLCEAFALWITGRPSAGKSTITAALTRQLEALGVRPAVLESDRLRTLLTPHPTYSSEERDTFYAAMLYVGSLLVSHGVPVIFDATANRRVYRDNARAAIPRFIEVFVDCPLELVVARDPKGIYRRGMAGADSRVPGMGVEYEPPLSPEVTVHGGQETAESAATRIIAELQSRKWLRVAAHGE